ncbi:ABC transporter substrate-binding protein [Roseibium marinum]|uniref:NitT/TauT family transport system substrate-binding protein n=1 Tax=Roseibium marinum TaxID=281252 RepID=A0A2S3UJI4_9HYPH|nr:PhnD/SsuA/transferrin family substrate-binding protein [Roseibium marinum]POF27733.1 NitT/TauT family transport system substrate-binding protein [Roseibium marinum]
MTFKTLLTRRNALSLLAAGVATPLLPAAAQADTIEKLSLFGPPAGPSVTLASAVANGGFLEIADDASFTAWRNPDELRAGLTSGEIGLSVVPVQAAANLSNRGFPIRLANVMTDGLLYIISEDQDIRAVTDLKGRSIAVPFRGDTPEIILTQLLAHNGLDPETDLDITYAGTPIEAMQLLLAERVEAALTAEPSTTAGILRGRQAGKTVTRVVNLQAAWGQMTGTAPVLPQAGLAVTQGFLDANGASLPDILAVLRIATSQVLANPSQAATHASEPLGLPVPLLTASIPHCNLVARPAGEARADIERMLKAMAGENMARIGGKLPDDGFYL